MLEKYIKYKSFPEFCVAFVQKYPDVKLPRKSLVRRLVAKFRETGSLLDESEEIGKGRSKGLIRNKVQAIPKTSRPLTTLRKSNGPVARNRKQDMFVSLHWTNTLGSPLFMEYKFYLLLPGLNIWSVPWSWRNFWLPYFPANKAHFFPEKCDLNSTCVLCAEDFMSKLERI